MMSSLLYLLFCGLAIVAGAISGYIILRHRGVDKRTAALSQLLLVIVIVIIGTKIELIGLKLKVSLDSLRALFAASISLTINACIFKKHRFDVLFATVVSMPLMYSIAKIGCTMAGCCRGFLYSGPLALRYGNAYYFPIQPLETLVFATIYIVGLKLAKKHNFLAINFAVIASLLAKTALEFLREEHGVSLSEKQIILLMSVILWIAIMLIIKKKAPQPGKETTNGRAAS